MPNSDKKLFYGLFIFPLLIAIGMAVLLCAVVLMTYERQTPQTLLEAIKTSSPNYRWQKAFELSNEINKHPGTLNNPAILKEMRQILNDSTSYDVKTRGYIALALSRDDSVETVQALISILKSEDEDLVIFSLWSLGKLKQVGAGRDIEFLLSHSSAAIRKVAAYVLGSISFRESIPSLSRTLNDPSADVRWNAALALARLGSLDGYDTLVSMLNRKNFMNENNISQEQVDQIMINAAKGLALIPKPDSIKILKSLSENDQSLKVRQAALGALKYLEKQI